MASTKTDGLLTVGLLALLASGCAYGELKQVLRAEFASELDCRDVAVRRRDTWYAYSENYFKVTGCGHLRTYTCPEGSGVVKYGSSPCKWIEGDIDSPQNTPKDAADPVSEPIPDEPPPPAMDEPSSSDSDSSAEPADDGMGGGGDLSSDTSLETKPTKAKAKASGSLKLGR